VGHPNRIPMKVEYSNVKAGCPQCVDAHVLNGSSGSMVVDEASGKVIGIVWGTFDGPVPACDAPYEPEPFYREWFSNPGAAALVTPAWIAAPHIP
jgi:hypothetical protein